MPSEIDYAKAGYYLEYLQHLSSELNEIADIKGTDVNWLINRVCTFSYEYNFPEANKSYDIKKEWIQLWISDLLSRKQVRVQPISNNKGQPQNLEL